MCSIISCSLPIDNLEYINYFTQFRGPDSTNTHTKNDVNFIHKLLIINGIFTTSPFIKENIVCLYNGEVYNYKDFGNYSSDGKCLIFLYLEYSVVFVSKFNGEFAIFLMYFSKDLSVASTEIFGKKPLWYEVNGEHFGIASYKSVLERIGHENIQRLKATA